MQRSTLHLASSSPRRRELLAALGLDFTAGGVVVEERREAAESPREMVLRLAREKALAWAGGEDLVLGADTAVVLGDRVFGKPDGEAQALEMLAELSGRTHRVLTGVALRAGDRVTTAVSGTDVVFREIRPDEARRYWQSGEPGDKAGAYGIQGMGGIFVASIDGSYSGVVGLPVFETAELLRGAGLDVLASGL